MNNKQEVYYLIKDDKLTRTFRWDDVPEELYLIEDDGSLLLYQEHLDGPLLDEEQAKEIFPEEFV